MLADLRQKLRHLPPGLRTRFAPSPTGYLHMGHAASAVYVWGIAQAIQADVLLRIEDHDQGRVRPEYTAGILEDLQWLGLIKEASPFVQQSQDQKRYQKVCQEWASKNLIFYCHCSRKDIQERTGEQSTDELRYDGHCRKARHPDREAGMRLFLETQSFYFNDLWLGPQTQRPAEQCGDLLLRDRHRNWTYNFAVSVDDAAEEIDLIIRGQDLLSASGRQLQLRALLGCSRPLQFIHHPLILETTGQKLSKRDGSTALRSLRDKGMRPETLLGQAAFQIGLLEEPSDISVDQLGEFFS